ncbi:hypothetical protein [Streptomyces sp. TLI_146]|uniref:hypothetical protein n=1 Tax=Streptomyces sp. TLI_146 TaxID=1938858 RepID=UPI000C70A849|nr:hypothetical protein [Streptomyces sp. TLI_146]PKV84240.1 hypothetical protein BX283_1752 [Streptomyces sp. TLI_146]
MISPRAMRPLPLVPIGYRRNGRPILPILGASSDDPSNQPPTDDPGPGGVAIPQYELSKLFAREKDQGRRAVVRDLLGQLGFDSTKALADFVQGQRDEEQSRKDAERALLSEAERREQSVTERVVVVQTPALVCTTTRGTPMRTGETSIPADIPRPRARQLPPGTTDKRRPKTPT